MQVFDILNVFFTVSTLSKRSQEDGEVRQDGLQKTFMLSLLLKSWLNAAKKHFNCEQLDGADLENQYQTGPIGSHWEGRTYSVSLLNCFTVYVVYYHLGFQSEIMAAMIEPDYSVSRVTLSFFEDSGYACYSSWSVGRPTALFIQKPVLIISPSGVFCTNFHYCYSFVNDVEFDFINSFMSFSSWYTVDYSKAMKWEYGRQLGCDFSMKSCFDYVQIRRQYNRKIIPFCDTVNEAKCRDAFSYGRCIIVRYGTPVPKEDRFFSKAPFDTEYPPEYFGGNDPFTDYCPTMAYVKGLGSEYSATSFCTHPENEILSREGVNQYYQTYGLNGICVEHRGVWNYTHKHEYTLGTYLKGSCHKYKCYNDGTLGLFFKDSTVNCTRKDEPVRFNVSDGESRLNGKILCPNVNRFCKVRLLCACIKYKK
ncbi:unnamed protein product [Schistosoma curassoni]|uniref:Leishmanolysin-like peptidase n=1 Tax=Schistosoma curassoni TaxID=6186 RepID=A0A183K176_9TREM|nr:unnamed protein product [Schistosoma curassoni]